MRGKAAEDAKLMEDKAARGTRKHEMWPSCYAPDEMPRRTGCPMRVLIVEDDERVVSYLVRSLEAEGFTVDTAFDGNAALEKALVQSYAAITLDIMLGTQWIPWCQSPFGGRYGSPLYSAKEASTTRRMPSMWEQMTFCASPSHWWCCWHASERLHGVVVLREVRYFVLATLLLIQPLVVWRGEGCPLSFTA